MDSPDYRPECSKCRLMPGRAVDGTAAAESSAELSSSLSKKRKQANAGTFFLTFNVPFDLTVLFLFL